MTRVLATLLALAVLAPVAEAKPALKRFKSCKSLVAYAGKHQPRYEPGGPPGQLAPPRPAPTRPTFGAPGAPVPASAPESGSGDSGSFSLTNNQEAGVFEPDIVKTDGRTVYAVTQSGVLRVVDVTGAPKVVGTLQLPAGYDHRLLLYQGKLLVASGTYDGQSTLALVDVTDGTRPAIEEVMTVDGTVLAERRTKGTVRVVLTVTPRAIAADASAPTASPARARSARAWLPRARINGRTRTLVGCKAVRRPRSFTGLEELTVLTIDLDEGLAPVDADAVMTGAGTVYASAGSLYVATQRYLPGLEDRTDGPVPEGLSTQVHRFSLDNGRNATYRGSGSVPGFVLNQFSMSEQDEVLRVASTESPPWFRGGSDSESFVTTLGRSDQGLSRLGQVGGLGKGERIYAVRFLGDRGFVVTYRQVDPLYALDLSDPEKPAVRGELKLPGFSSYLHPVSGDRLLGVGTSETGGVQFSAFDVSDLAAPRLQQQVEIADASTEVSYDHLAFLWWEPRSLAVFPVSVYEPFEGCSSEQPCPAIARSTASAFAFTVRPEAITEAGRVAHPGNATVRRSILLGDRLLTMSDAGLQASALDGYADLGFAAF